MESATALQSKIIYCLMGRLGVSRVTCTTAELKAHAKDAHEAEITYSVNDALGAVTVTIGEVNE